ncbi:MAG: hypothetical protein AAFN10_11310 [Bacteroidota bacterium]
MKTQTKEKLAFSIQFEGQPDRDFQLFAFAFDRRGKLIAKSKILKNRGSFGLSPMALKQSQVFITPMPDGGFAERIDIPYLNRLQAFSPSINLRNNRWEIPLIPEQNWKFWLWKLCPVRARTVKPIFEDGSFLNAPVCEARVHICEVDRILFLLPSIPDDIIFRLREDLLFPIPKPDPIPDPGPRIELPPINPPLLRLNGRGNFEHSAIPAIEAVSAQSISQLPALPNALVQQLNSPLADQLRLSIANNFQLIHPYLCFWPQYWPFFYRCDEIAVVETDANGRLDTSFWYQCFKDQPDLYFWVEFKVGGVWTTVYRPPIACNTYWNYNCGDEITIRLTDPRVDACGDLYSPPGLAAVVEKIGNHAYIPKINQANTASNINGVAFREIGLTELGLNQSDPITKTYRRPFGSKLPLYVHFSQDLIDSGVTHYRWSFRKLQNADGASDLSPWQHIDHEVSIKYRDDVGKKAYPLGPLPAYSLPTFLIPPTNAADLPGLDPTKIQGYSLTDRYVSAWFDTPNLTDPGLYELKLELVKIVAGQPVVAAVADDTFQIPQSIGGSFSTYDNADATGYVHSATADAGAVLETGAKVFRFKIRVDNAPVLANLRVPEINGNAANPNCGFVPYPAMVDSEGNITPSPAAELALSFEAAHPRDFANFSLRLRRGNITTPLAPGSTSGGQIYIVGRDWDAGKFALQSDGDYHVSPFHVSSVLGGCDQAAYSLDLYVNALATNGTSDLNHLDQRRVSSFAIEPETTP